ncbi:MAG: hypothetical protein ACNA7U_04535 [Candidatus Izemoplasmataceae bacterium]
MYYICDKSILILNSVRKEITFNHFKELTLISYVLIIGGIVRSVVQYSALVYIFSFGETDNVRLNFIVYNGFLMVGLIVLFITKVLEYTHYYVNRINVKRDDL